MSEPSASTSPPDSESFGAVPARIKDVFFGRYKSGRFKDKPRARIVFEVTGGEHTGQLASRLLPWFPDWHVFQHKFEQLTGMSYAQWGAFQAERGAETHQEKAALFLSVLQAADFQVELERNGRYLNVGEIRARTPRAAGPKTGTVEADIHALMADLCLDGEAITALCVEEFGAGPKDLSAEDRETLRDLLAERKAERDHAPVEPGAEDPASGDADPEDVVDVPPSDPDLDARFGADPPF